jgi:dTDP-4-amino-4,6-dideoxygalactose transaminase
MKVPLLDLTAQNGPLKDEILAAIAAVVNDNSFIMGPEIAKLEKSIGAYSGARHAIGVSSGTDAILIALMALDIKAGDEVITTPYSFFATAGCVTRLGAKPVLVDIDPVTYNIDPALIGDAITPRTRAIIPVHLYGQCADMDPILDIASRHGLAVVEDAAQAIGAEYRDGRRAGSMGRIGCLSFYPSKNLGAFGDAGMVLCQDDALGEKIRTLRVHGGKPKYFHSMIGGNFRLDSIQAAVLNVKLGHLDSWTRKRQENALRYTSLFESSGLPKKAGIRLPEAVYQSSGVGHFHIYNQYVIRVPERDRLREHLAKKEISTEIYYPVPFHMQECFKYLGYKEGDFPQSERAAQETIALPIYPELIPGQQEYVVEETIRFYADNHA